MINHFYYVKIRCGILKLFSIYIIKKTSYSIKIITMLLDDQLQDPNEIKKQQFIDLNFFQLPYPNQYQCKQCTLIISLNTQDDFEQMQNHIEKYHQRKFDEHHQNSTVKIAYFYERLRNARPPPRYLYRYNEQKYIKLKLIKDQWLDRLAIDGYPIPQVVQGILNRLISKQDRNYFFEQSQQRAKYLLKCIPQIKKFINHLPMDLLPGQVIWVLKDTFKISPQAAQTIVQKYYYPYTEEIDLLRFLQKRGVIYRQYKSKESQSLTIFATEKMRKNYLEFGDCVSVSYHLIPLRRDRVGRHHNVIIFAGQDRNLKHLLFGLGLANGQSYLYYKLCLQYFLQIMDYVEPQTFLVNSYQIMEDALNDLKKEYGYNFEIRCHWKHVKQLLRLNFDTTAAIGLAMNLFSEAMSSFQNDQFQNIMKFLRKGKLLDAVKVDNFEKKGYKYCQSKGRPSFVGFCPDQNFMKTLNTLVHKSFEPFQRYKGQFYCLCMRLQKIVQDDRVLESLENIKNQNNSQVQTQQIQKQAQKHRVFLSQQLKHLYQIINIQIFRKILSNYQKSTFNVSVIQKHSLHYILLDKTVKNGRTTPTRIQVSYDLCSSKWKCVCNQLYFTGIPCSHLIKVIFRNNGCIVHYINHRWLHSYNLQNFPGSEQCQDDGVDSIDEDQFPKATSECEYWQQNKVKKQQKNDPIVLESESDSSIGIIKVEKATKKQKSKYIVLDQLII